MFNVEVNYQPKIENLDLNYLYDSYRTVPLYLASENINNTEDEDDLILSSVNIPAYNNQSQTNPLAKRARTAPPSQPPAPFKQSTKYQQSPKQ